jgi:hypothetical protein
MLARVNQDDGGTSDSSTARPSRNSWLPGTVMRRNRKQLWSSKAAKTGFRVGFAIGLLIVILDWIDYVWLCKADCGTLATAIAATVLAPLFFAWLGGAVVVLWKVWGMVRRRREDEAAHHV